MPTSMPLIPTEVPAPRRLTGEQELRAALIEGALQDCARGSKREREDALAWVMGAPAEISFASACEVLGFDVDAIRDAFRRRFKEFA